jgi:hypothetical protein
MRLSTVGMRLKGKAGFGVEKVPGAYPFVELRYDCV